MAESIVTSLPLYSDLEYAYSATFGSKEVIVEIFYNPRVNGWHMDISDSDFTYLVRGLKLLPSANHGADFSMSHYGIDGYLYMEAVTPNLKYEDIDPKAIFQYYNLFYIEAV